MPPVRREFRWNVVWPRLLLLSLALLTALHFGSSLAGAEEHEPPTYEPPNEIASEPPLPEGQPSCPDSELEPFEGEDVAAGETRLLRGELAEVCAALAARLDRLRERAWWSVLEQLRAAEQRVVTNEKITTTNEGIDDLLAVLSPAEGVFPVEDSAVATESSSVVEAVDASGEAVRSAIWFLVGLMVMSAGLALYKQLRP